MIGALAGDLSNIADVDVCAMRDRRFEQLTLPDCEVRVVASSHEVKTGFRELASAADFTVLIAPEFNDILLNRVLAAEAINARLLSPDSRFVRLAADKLVTQRQLAARGVPTSQATLFKLPLATFPAVVKPRRGAGSLGVQVVSSPTDQLDVELEDAIVEPFQAGLPVSVAVLCGPNQMRVPLAACQQRLSTDGRLQYLGGALPLSAALETRAEQLAVNAIAALPETTGYVGVDLVLGEESDGSKDVAIEVNPRLTTSYIGLRAACRSNLAKAMIDAAIGEPVSLSFAREPLEFTA